tara:strand:+ start:1055 stop:1333 length:279 start_codon:yes stop_codon:yes gene_type:complete
MLIASLNSIFRPCLTLVPSQGNTRKYWSQPVYLVITTYPSRERCAILPEASLESNGKQDENTQILSEDLVQPYTLINTIKKYPVVALFIAGF